ncbi:dihydrolipoamide acetyltransferase [Mycolicibacterium conceptionense]|uniref:Dihydrolipoyllysine-residue acetyltransferase component of pyruvate dehydrogenase complex n=1 Tax=Mycolicibacterium conceptionense TaxID=451644 RepID=A0A0U1DR62_9MYCO|nr:dihydrolipoamide acetyltransferase [Mycolicibacterium conceptionense]
MAISVQMPALGESVTEGTVTRWLKQEGDTVELDEPLLEVSTDKVDTEIPSPAAGVLTKIVAQEDDTVEIGGELAVIGEAGEQASEAPAAEPESKPEPEPQTTHRGPPAPTTAAPDRPLRLLPWPTCAEPRRRPTGFARSPRRRPANRCRRPLS